MMIKHVLSLQTDAGQKSVLLFDPFSQTLVSSPDKEKKAVSFHDHHFLDSSLFCFLVKFVFKICACDQQKGGVELTVSWHVFITQWVQLHRHGLHSALTAALNFDTIRPEEVRVHVVGVRSSRRE